MMRLPFFYAYLILLLAPVTSAHAQSQPDDTQGPPAPKIVQRCRNTTTGEIVVCGRQERSPYRLPEPPPGFDPDGGVDSVSRERHSLYEVGETGIGSCSNVGPGGTSGCSFKAWKNDHEQRDGHGRKKGLISKVRDRYEPIDPEAPQ